MHEPVDQVEVYEKLKPKLGDEAAKVLLRYMEEVTRTVAVTKDDLYSLREELREDFQSLREEVRDLKADLTVVQSTMTTKDDLRAVKDDLWKLRLLIIMILIVVLLFNPTVIDLIVKIFGIRK